VYLAAVELRAPPNPDTTHVFICPKCAHVVPPKRGGDVAHAAATGGATLTGDLD